MAKQRKITKPRDWSQLALSVVQQATGEVPKKSPPTKKNSAAIRRGRLGGIVGGTVRAKKLSSRRRREIAKSAARSRWNQ